MNVLDLFSLKGKVALVTGCRRGIGFAMAQALAEAGADIVGVSAQMEGADSAVGKYVTSLGRKFWGFSCDFSDRKALYGFVEKVNREAPPIALRRDTRERAPARRAFRGSASGAPAPRQGRARFRQPSPAVLPNR